MNGRRDETPERLLSGEATAFERRVLQQALSRGPSKELTQRMAKALGVGITTAPSSASGASSPAAPAAASPAAAASSAAWIWGPAAVIALSVAGLMIGMRGQKPSLPAAPATHVEVPASPAIAPVFEPAPASPTSVVTAAGLPKAPALARVNADLRGEIELVDGARAALAAKSGRRALEILHSYDTRYPRGSFGPEATAVKVEALMQLGRADEARALASRFVADHKGTLLGDRVAAVAGLERP